MKRIIALLFVLAIFIPTMVSCSEAPTKTTEDEKTSKSVSPTETPNPTETSVTVVTPTPTFASSKDLTTAEILKGKTALFVGDSIVMASTYDKDHQWWGYAGRIHRDYGLASYKNVGVDGASVSNCRPNNQIVSQIKNNGGNKYDFVVLEGGTNDGWDVAPVGTVSDIAPEDVTSATFERDLGTFCGGLENLLYYTKLLNKDATIIYIITPRMSMNVGTLKDMRAYVDATLQICEKWDIPVMNFYDLGADFYLSQNMKKYFGMYLADGCHPNSKGYEYITPYIADAMADAYKNRNIDQ